MLVKDVMTQNPTYITPSTTLKEAAQKMQELDCGFLAIGVNDKLTGVVTDRDIAVRAVSSGANPEQATVDEIKTSKVLYCFQEDSIEDAAENLHRNQVYRLLVLNDKESKRLCGVITLGDIVRHNEMQAADKAAKGISTKLAA